MSTATLEPEQKENQLVAFHLANEIYAVDISAINEIILLPEITHIPHTSKDILGVINLRGKIVPILDLRKRLGLPYAEATRSTRVIVVEQADSTVGMIVDDVVGVMKIQSSEIEPPSEFIKNLNTNPILGVGKAMDTLLILLNIAQVLSVPPIQSAA
ncbi:chemotaxis protein CheW [Armatimonadota bacterium]|nr:chemotaxis protein CheW [Armatimonadota bacterium]